MCIILFWSADVIFGTLTRIHEKQNLKKFENKFVLSAHMSFLEQKTPITSSFSINDLFTLITFPYSL